jgi:hypothetical protein
MVTEQLSKAKRHQLRVTFFDFAVRGEGDRATVSRAIEAWRACGALSAHEADRWQDALEWRELGGLLPGWSMPPQMAEKRGAPDESDLRAFDAWRAALRASRAA